VPGRRKAGPAPGARGRRSAARDRRSLSAVDLNLLVVLDAILTEGNVTRAAERVGMTQPAMSQALARLRRLFDDPLFVRTPRGMIATARASELAAPVRRALGEIDRALASSPSFDPRTARRAFTLATLDHGELVILLPLLQRLAAEAPGIDLRVRPLRFADLEEELESGAVDLAIGVLAPGDEPSLNGQKLFREHFVCMVRADHPEVGATLSLAEYVALDHALVSPRGRPGSLVDAELAKRGLERRVALVVPHFAVAPMIVARSDLVLTVPERIAHAFAAMLPLRTVPPPLELPGFDVVQLWHERRQQDRPHTWLRGLVLSVCRSLKP
jgi:DNA-binding transcriptional LysR family regulator